MISIFIPYQNNRTRYVFSQVFTRWLKVEHMVFSDQETFSNHQARVKINYSSQPVLAGIHIPHSEFLNSKSSSEIPLLKGEGSTLKLFPGVSEGVFDFDLFAAIFWCITRYEEYGNHKTDKYGRYPDTNSILFQKNALMFPLVDIWMEQLRMELNRCAGIDWIPADHFKIINTVDIDNAYAIKGKGFVRNAGAIGKHLVKAEFSKIAHRRKVNNGSELDVYDTYEFIKNVSANHDSKPVLFYLLGDYGGFDKNLSHKSEVLKNLVASNTEWSISGIHPSFKSFLKEDQVKTEIERLEKLTGQSVNFSRQHYLRMQIPETYRILNKLGIKTDFTMGYASTPGFRAGTGREHIYFDVEKDQEIQLSVQPFCVMDGTFVDYMKVDISEAKKIVHQLITELKKVNSTYVAIWHNETLNDSGKWKGWREVYQWQFIA